MKLKKSGLIIGCFLAGVLIIACSSDTPTEAEKPLEKTNDFLVDSMATPETVKLFNNLSKIAARGVMFGHQDDLAYGVGWWAEAGRSDVKEVCGDYPAVYGWDLGEVLKENIAKLQERYKEGKFTVKEARRGNKRIDWNE